MIPEEKRFYLDTDDSWCCWDCGEGQGVFVDLLHTLPDGARYVRCAHCEAADGIVERDDLRDMEVEP